MFTQKVSLFFLSIIVALYSGLSLAAFDETTYKSVYKEALAGDVSKQVELAQSYLFGLFTEVDYTKAVAWYRKAAEQKHSSSQYSLGMLYEAGMGVKASTTEAFKWYLQAANQGHAESQYLVGTFYMQGKATKSNYSEGIRWYQRAAEQNHVKALIALGCHYAPRFGHSNNPVKALENFRRALSADPKNGDAALGIGTVYWYADKPIRHRTKALNYFVKASESGLPIAYYMVGHAYDIGEGVRKNQKLAKEWYGKACDKGFDDGCTEYAKLSTVRN